MMKKLAFIIAFMVSALAITAQNSKVQSAINYSKPQYNELGKAKEAIDLASKHHKTSEKAKTWKVRGQVYQAIAQSQDEKFKNLSDNPLGEALAAYKKAMELDDRDRYTKEIENQLKLLGIAFINKGIDYFNKENFEMAFKSFENSLNIDKMVAPEKVDTMVIFNAGIAADRAKMYDEAIEYYKKSTDLKYEGAKVYGFIANIEKNRKDTAGYVAALKEGINAYPENNNVLMVELINHYLNNEQSDLALEYLDKAIQKDGSNPTFYFAQGALYDKLGEFEKAKASYEKAVEIKPDYFDAYYNLGALYFNKGADLLKKANEIPPNETEKYNAAVKASFVELDKAVPYLERAHEIDPTERSTMLTLKEIYFKLRNDKEGYEAKFKEINEKLKALPQE